MEKVTWQAISRHDATHVCGFFGPYRFLSNFHLSPVFYEGLYFPSSEHAYQAAKLPLELRTPFTSPFLKASAAKRIGSDPRLQLDLADWNSRKFDVMSQVVLDKFTRTIELALLLNQTGTKYLEETNWWGDTYWGVCKNVGENKLGQILMTIRESLQ